LEFVTAMIVLQTFERETKTVVRFFGPPVATYRRNGTQQIIALPVVTLRRLLANVKVSDAAAATTTFVM